MPLLIAKFDSAHQHREAQRIAGRSQRELARDRRICACLDDGKCRLNRPSSVLQTLISDELYFAFNLHRNIERKFGKAHGAATVGTHVRPVKFKDEVGESVDDIRLLVEARRRIDHAEYARPGRYAVKVAKRTLEASEDGECDKTGGEVTLFERHLAPKLAERFRKGAIRVLRAVAGDQYPVAENPNEPEGKDDTGWRLRRRWKREPQCQ